MARGSFFSSSATACSISFRIAPHDSTPTSLFSVTGHNPLTEQPLEETCLPALLQSRRRGFTCNKSPEIAFVLVQGQQEAPSDGGEEMRSNVGTTDRVIRIVLGIILVALGLRHTVTGGLAIAAYVVGAIALVTGVVRYCPRGQFLESIRAR